MTGPLHTAAVDAHLYVWGIAGKATSPVKVYVLGTGRVPHFDLFDSSALQLFGQVDLHRLGCERSVNGFRLRRMKARFIELRDSIRKVPE